jgi:hypothetical protein
MRRVYIPAMLLLVLFAGSLYAQNIPVAYQYSTTSAPSGMVQFDFDIGDSTLADTSNNHYLIYRDQPQTSWNSADMDFLYHVCSTYTFSGQLTYTPPSNVLEWYLHSENDSAVVSQSPKNEANQFPPPMYLMADMGADPAGDAEGTSATNLDITHLYATWSDTKLYFRLDNNGGGFPTSSGLFTYFVYAVGVVDPNTTDSVAYALVYASVPLLFNPGLYALDATDSSFTQIASISYQISGNSIYMSCNISDLTAQPAWSDWPPPAGFIGLQPYTITMVFTDMTFNDNGKMAVFIPESNLLDFTLTNTSPALSDASVALIAPDTITAGVTYTDTDNHLPAVRNLHFESAVYPMGACIKTYDSGALFEYSLNVSETGWYSYYFEFSDGVDTVVTPLDSSYFIIKYHVCGDADSEQNVNISDAVYIINYIFAEGNPPDPIEAGDVNCDTEVNVSDAVFIINYIFAGGNEPCDTNGDAMPDC